MMAISQSDWDDLANFLHRNKLAGIFEFLLEAGAPIKILFAQTLYLINPFFSHNKLDNFAKIFENHITTKEFLDYLKLQD
jgi:hypothetical protein